MTIATTVLRMPSPHPKQVPVRLAGFVSAAILVCFSTSAGAAPANPPGADVDTALRKAGLEPTRGINSDICFPATAEEYEALGKNAVLRVMATSVLSTELPLRSVYAVYKGVRIPLQRTALLDQEQDASSVSAQVSFYLLPIQLMKNDVVVSADFRGDRKDFSFLHFSAKQGLDKSAPPFVRLDEYDTPGDPDPKALAAVLTREYPDDFP